MEAYNDDNDDENNEDFDGEGGDDDMVDENVGEKAEDYEMEEDVEEEQEIPDIPDHATILANKKAHPLFARLFRSKGELFLATRPNRTGEWSQAGSMLTIQGGRPWFCVLPESEYVTGSEEIDGLVKHDIAKGGEWGDRRQEIVFIGEDLDVKALEQILDSCLLDDGEWEFWAQTMRESCSDEEKVKKLHDRFDDGFPDWDDGEEDEQSEADSHNHAGHSHASHSQASRQNGGGRKAKHIISKGGLVSVSA